MDSCVPPTMVQTVYLQLRRSLVESIFTPKGLCQGGNLVLWVTGGGYTSKFPWNQSQGSCHLPLSDWQLCVPVMAALTMEDIFSWILCVFAIHTAHAVSCSILPVRQGQL